MARYSGTNILAVLSHMERDEAWLARKMGYDLSTVWRVNRGQRAVSGRFVERACAVLNLPAEVLFIPAVPELVEVVA